MGFGISTLDNMPRRVQIFQDETKVIWEVFGKEMRPLVQKQLECYVTI